MLKRNKLFMFAVLALITTLVTCPTHKAMAETSEANISFKENNGPTDPVDPEDPSQPGEGPGTGTPGPLSIDYISNLPFGTNNVISNQAQIYYSDTAKPYIQVTDLRGTGAGWKITATSSGFTQKDLESGDNVETLKGSKILLLNGKPNSVNMSLAAPAIASRIELTPDNHDVLIASADEDAGMGTWVLNWFTAGSSREHVQLLVPAGTALLGAHEANITWNLSDAP